MTATTTKISTHQPMGEYKPTAVDAQKAACDFLITASYKGKFDIRWSDGRTETVSWQKMAGLKSAHTWGVDF